MTAIMIEAGARKAHPAALCFAINDIPFFLGFTENPPFTYKPLT